MYFDGSFTLNCAGRGMVLIYPKGDQLLYVIQLHFRATNNVVEYVALVNGLHNVVELGVQRIYIRGDFELVVNQVMGDYIDSFIEQQRKTPTPQVINRGQHKPLEEIFIIVVYLISSF
jgi:ribonuclease HI